MDKAIRDLNDIIYDLQREIEDLKGQIQRANRRIEYLETYVGEVDSEGLAISLDELDDRIRALEQREGQ
jgi:prefoldin subunit 5